MSTPTTPPARPSARRAITPHVLVGTTTVTGASGSAPLAAPMARASAASASAGRTAEVVSVTGPIVRKGCDAAQPEGSAASARARRSLTACSRPSGSRNSALPAMSTLAPAAAAPAIVRRRDSAVDLHIDRVGVAGVVEHPSHLGDLRLHRRDVRLAAEAGVDGHHEHQADEVEHVLDGRCGRRGVQGDCRRCAEVVDVGRACGAGGGRPRRARSGANSRRRCTAWPSRRA